VFTTGPFGVVTQTNVALIPAQTQFGGVLIGGPALVTINDTFRTTNNFNGGVFGLRSEGRYGMFTFTSVFKASIGDMHERIDIFGGSNFVDPTGRSGVLSASTTFNTTALNSGAGGGTGGAVGGVLANAGNIGTYVRDRFTVIPEIGLNFGIALTRGCTGYVGVNLIYFPNVIRPGEVVSPLVSSSAIPLSPSYGTAGARRGPPFLFNETDQWLGGVNFGMVFKY
jgi:hypothetical protein